MYKNNLFRSLLTLGAILIAPFTTAAQNSPHVPGELLIAPKAGVSSAELENIYKSHGGKRIAVLSQIATHHIAVPEHALEKIEAALAKNPKIEFVEKNFIAETNFVPNDPGYSTQWHLSRISAPGAWDVHTGSSGVVIAVLDSGIDTNHPDLMANIVAGKNFLDGSNNVYDNGSNGGHGTAASGTAAASGNNGLGVSGVSWKNSIMPLVVVKDNWATYSNIASAINYAADKGVKVISMSLAGTSSSSTLESAVNYAWNKGSVLVASAGNYGNNSPTYPGSFKNVVAVTATDQSDNPASFTSYGSWVTVAAPGTYIYTTKLGGGYGAWQGTSFSTPQVAGLAALIFSANPKLSNAQVVELIKKNADDLGAAGFDPYYGWGRVNAQRALQAAYAAPAAPSVSITSPASGSTVSGTVNVSVSASSAAGIAKIELYVDGALAGSTNSSSYSFPWNTSGLSGSHSLVAKAYDGAGGTTTSSTVTVSVTSTSPQPPSVAITSPASGATVSGTVNVSVSASSAAGISKVDLFINGALAGSTNSSPYSFPWNTTGLSGSHSLVAKAYDGVGGTATSSTVTVSVSSTTSPPSDTTAPSVQFTKFEYDGKFLNIEVSATDSQSGVSKVEVYANGKLAATDSSKPFSFKLNTKPWGRGNHSVQATAYDNAGNSASTASVSVTTN